MTEIYAGTAGLLFALGLYGMIARRTLMQRLVAANVTASSVFLYLVVLTVRDDGPADPVPQAMVLTGIVIAVSITAFALALARWLQDETGAVDLEEPPAQDGAENANSAHD